MRIKTVLFTILVVNFCVLSGLAWVQFDRVSQSKVRTQYLADANELCDHLVSAAAEQAKERGFTNAWLTADVENNGLKEKVLKARVDGDAALVEAQVHWEAMEAANRSHQGAHTDLFKAKLAAYHESLESLKAMRDQVDDSIGAAPNSIDSATWVPGITATINAGRALRLAAAHPVDTTELLVYTNSRIKDIVWLASENAGLERANIAAIISAGKTIPADKKTMLDGRRAVVEESISQVKALAEAKDQEKSILDAVANMEDTFLGKFQDVREQVYEASRVAQEAGSPPVYPIDAAGWLGASTEGINSLLAVASAVSARPAKLAEEGVKAQALAQNLAVAALVLTIVLTGLMFLTFERRVLGPVAKAGSVMGEVASSHDLRMRAPDKSKDELGVLAKSFNGLVNEFQAIVHKLVDTSAAVAASSEQLAAASDETAKTVQQVAATVTEVAKGSEETRRSAATAQTSMKDAESRIEGMAADASSASSFAKNATELGMKGKDATDEAVRIINMASASVSQTAEVVQSLEGKTEKIGEFIAVITGIADQTNLLALNAAIEAARAGDAGRGFAVVAEEVRKLAEESNQAAGSITQLVKGIRGETVAALDAMRKSTAEVSQGTESVNEASRVLDQIVSGVASLSEKVKSIDEAARGISTSAEQVMDAMQSVSAVAEQNSAAATQVSAATEQQTAAMEEIGASAASLARLAQDMQELVGQFQV